MRRFGATVLLVVMACGGDDGSSSTSGSSGTSGSAASEIVDDGIAVRDAWVRPTPATATEAAIYLVIENLDAPDDELLGGRSGQCVTVQAHRTTVDDEGVAVMSAAGPGELAVRPGAPLILEPNGLHLMCAGLSSPFRPGDPAELTLVFAHHPPITIPLTVTHR